MKKEIPEDIKAIFRAYGRKGGKKTKEKYGTEHYRKMRAKRGEKKLSTVSSTTPLPEKKTRVR